MKEKTMSDEACRRKFVAVTKDMREKIKKIFGCTDKSIWNALNYDAERGNTDQARRIRKAAKEMGGVEMLVSPEMETMHDADGYMRQYLPNGAMLEFSKEDGSCVIYYKGEAMQRYENVLVRDIEKLQKTASEMCDYRMIHKTA